MQPIERLLSNQIATLSQMFADQQPTGKVTKVPVPASTHLYVQLGAFSKLENFFGIDMSE